MLRSIQFIRILYYFVRGSMNIGDVSYSIKVADIMMKLNMFDGSVEAIKKLPGGTQFFLDRKISFRPSLKQLSVYSPGTLGHAYFEFLTKNNLDPESLPAIPYISDAQYLENVVRDGHDIWHVLTGFDASVAGEVGLQGFKVRQFQWPFALIVMAAVSLITLYKDPRGLGEIFESFVRGYMLGGKYKNVAMVDWMPLLGENLANVQKILAVADHSATPIETRSEFSPAT